MKITTTKSNWQKGTLKLKKVSQGTFFLKFGMFLWTWNLQHDILLKVNISWNLHLKKYQCLHLFHQFSSQWITNIYSISRILQLVLWQNLKSIWWQKANFHKLKVWFLWYISLVTWMYSRYSNSCYNCNQLFQLWTCSKWMLKSHFSMNLLNTKR